MVSPIGEKAGNGSAAGAGSKNDKVEKKTTNLKKKFSYKHGEKNNISSHIFNIISKIKHSKYCF